MTKFNKVISNLRTRRSRVLNGLFNCIPCPFPRLKRLVPGVEQGKYIVVTANQKVGKSKLCDYMFIYEPLFFILEHPEIRMKVLYFTLEMSPEEKYNEFLSHLLYRLDNIRVSPTDLKSTDQDHPIDEHILDLLETDKYQMYIKAFESIVEYIDDVRNPTGINNACKDYALSHGHLNFKTIVTTNNLGISEERKIVDTDHPYTPDDPEEYRLIILDNASNLENESGLKKAETIERMSKYLVKLRNRFKYIPILIQHQAQAQESIENQKFGRLKPSSDGLADCKTTTRDANMVIGLYSPFKFGIKEHENYDITKFRNRIRFMEVIEDRDYGANGQICPLFFDGAVSSFTELPLPNDKDSLDKVYNYIKKLEQAERNKSNKILMVISKVRGLHNSNKDCIFASLFRNLRQVWQRF